MLNIKQFAIYKSLSNEKNEYRQIMINDLRNLDIHFNINTDSSDISESHFNHVEQVKHPDASKHWVVINARINMLNFAYDDLINDKKSLSEVANTIHEVEDLEERDAIYKAKEHAKQLHSDDEMSMIYDKIKK